MSSGCRKPRSRHRTNRRGVASASGSRLDVGGRGALSPDAPPLAGARSSAQAFLQENVSLADILSLRDRGLSEQEAWAVCLECSRSMRSVAHSALFQTLCITPDTLAFNTSGNVCFMEQLSGEAWAGARGERERRAAQGDAGLPWADGPGAGFPWSPAGTSAPPHRCGARDALVLTAPRPGRAWKPVFPSDPGRG